MRRTCLVVGVIAIALVVARLDAQSRPDFSGKWVFASSQPLGTQALGGDFSIDQDATTLTIESTRFRVNGSTTGGWSETSFPIRTIYVLDGVEHPSREIVNQPVISPSAWTFRSPIMLSTTEESISKATWVGRQVLIMTYDRIRNTARNLTPPVSETRRTERQALSMDADGTLVVEKLIVAEPLPWDSKAPPPTPVRSIYKKG